MAKKKIDWVTAGISGVGGFLGLMWVYNGLYGAAQREANDRAALELRRGFGGSTPIVSPDPGLAVGAAGVAALVALKAREASPSVGTGIGIGALGAFALFVSREISDPHPEARAADYSRRP